MSNLVVILGDQLNLKMSSLGDFNKDTDSILMSEVREEATYVKHHKKKIAFVLRQRNQAGPARDLINISSFIDDSTVVSALLRAVSSAFSIGGR